MSTSELIPLARKASAEPVIHLDGLGKRFGSGTGQVRALRSVSVTIREGERVALLGLSGSGKSTLLRQINGLHLPSEGEATVLGTRLHTGDRRRLRELRRRIGFVFQQFDLVGSRTALENVCTGALGELRGPRLGLLSYPRRIRERALAGLAAVGLAEHAFQRADTLSGGQQQRVAVARALLPGPRILLADEPVASLDPESSAQIMRLLAEAGKGRTVLCSLHQVELALAFADRIIGLRDGTVVLDRPTAELDGSSVTEIYAQVGPDLAGARR
ncbi:phosphonate ABC transporter ATP-binding protein [Sciscionella sediminilitoris]|uniref:phosphonate ABC transporter ATP-binding protein n=1 Tax=Sciscionella sediminilitoris TaxID=1445613 RepID=UPI00068B106B|nr:ATP-binding cassette domain-containing protein [Sciscionella sp. SE31]